MGPETRSSTSLEIITTSIISESLKKKLVKSFVDFSVVFAFVI